VDVEDTAYGEKDICSEKERWWSKMKPRLRGEEQGRVEVEEGLWAIGSGLWGKLMGKGGFEDLLV